MGVAFPEDWPLGDQAEPRPRARPLLVAGRLSGALGDDVCVLVEITRVGALVLTRLPLRIDDPVALETGRCSAIPARVRVIGTGGVRLEFDRLLDPALVAAVGDPVRPGADVAGCRRADHRLRRCAPAELMHRGHLHEGELFDISCDGAGVDIGSDKGFVRGDRVELRLDRLGERDGAVRWAKGSRIGISFDFPLSLWKLDKWLIAEMDKCETCDTSACSAPSFNRALARRGQQP